MNLKNSYKAVILVYLVTICNLIHSQSVGINTTGTAPDPSALLDIDAAPTNNKGLLLPRLSTAERNTIVSPAQSLLIYNTTDSCYQGYIGTQWISFGCGGSPPPIPFCRDMVTTVVDVLNPATGKIWMDRNLGASQAATSTTDIAAYGDLYQWGRCSDGHEKRTSGTTSTLSSSDTPGHGNFIIIVPSVAPNDWRSPQNTNLWQGVNGINNPCPTSYRLPTAVELDAERLSWSSNNNVGAFNSPLKFALGSSFRDSGGAINFAGSWSYFWSSTVGAANSNYMRFGTTSATMGNWLRAYGYAVRCIKD